MVQCFNDIMAIMFHARHGLMGFSRLLDRLGEGEKFESKGNARHKILVHAFLLPPVLV